MDITQVADWEIERKLGAGGMGTVYLGKHRETGQQAAIKVLPASLAREEGFVERFKREIASMKQLKSPHIVEFFESGNDGDTYYYSMEYVDGETLTARLKRDKRIPWQEVIDYSLQICRALKAAHNTGIIHRDLKPSNLMLASDGTIKLTDFGVAQVFASQKLTITGGIVGTAEYMSPEQAKGQRATKKSDLYSLGAVMYVMLTGRPPFSGKSSLDVIHKHQFGQFDRPGLIATDMPRQLEEIVCKLLEKDPDKRFPDSYVLSLRLAEVQKRFAWQAAQKAAEVAPSGLAAAPIVDFAAATEAGLRARAAEDVPLSPTVLITDPFGKQIPVGATIPTPANPVASDNAPVMGATLTSPSGQPSGRESDATRHLVGQSQGPGTIMRNLMRKVITEQQEGGALSRVLDKTWAQVAALILLIGGVWWFRTHDMPAQDRLEKAREIAAKSDPTASEIGEAREHLQKVDRQDHALWEKEAEPLLDRLNVHEMRNNLRRGRTKDVVTTSEPKRLQKLARHYWLIGDYAQAERLLQSLIALTADQPEFKEIYSSTRELLNTLHDERGQQTSSNWLATALRRADTLQDEGKHAEAIVIWQSIINLYASDVDAAAYVTRARQNLEASAATINHTSQDSTPAESEPPSKDESQ
jgi:tetratricopeptide (TPR) repeat protein